MADIITKVEVTGQLAVTQLSKSTTFTLDEKLEDSIKLNNSSRTIDFDYVDNIRTIIVDSDGEFTVSITAGGSTIEFACQDTFYFTPTPAFRATITDFTIKETNSVDRLINIRIFGEEVTP